MESPSAARRDGMTQMHNFTRSDKTIVSSTVQPCLLVSTSAVMMFQPSHSTFLSDELADEEASWWTVLQTMGYVSIHSGRREAREGSGCGLWAMCYGLRAQGRLSTHSERSAVLDIEMANQCCVLTPQRW